MSDEDYNLVNDLIGNLLKTDIKLRILPTDVLQHKFFE